MTNENLMKNFRALNYTSSKIRQRFETALERGVNPLTFKMIYASEGIFEKYVPTSLPWFIFKVRTNLRITLFNYRMLQKSIELAATLKEIANIETYFRNQLNVDDKFISEVKEHYPYLLRTKPKKVKKIMEFLLDSGYTKEEIKSTIYIFGKREESVKVRWKFLALICSWKNWFVIKKEKKLILI